MSLWTNCVKLGCNLKSSLTKSKTYTNLILWLYELFSREKYLLKCFQELEATNVIDAHKLMQ